MNLVSQGSFEFTTSGWAYKYYRSFANNPTCWITANKNIYTFTLMPQTDSNRQFHLYARTGVGAFCVDGGGPSLNLKTGKWRDTTNESCNYVETKLLAPLVAGKKYILTMYFGSIIDTSFPGIARGDVVANVGAYFSNQLLQDTSTWGRFKVRPQINFTQQVIPVFDTFVYIKLCAAYTAQGGEQYMTLGNFDKYNDFVFLNIAKEDQIAGYSAGYQYNTYIDDVSLVADTSKPMISLDTFRLGRDTSLCQGQKLKLAGNVSYFPHYWWSTGDTSRAIMIDSPGRYWCTVDYGCGNFSDTIQVYGPLKPLRQQDTLVLCNRQLPYTYRLKGTATTDTTIRYHWSDGSRGDTLLVSSAGVYYCYRSNVCGKIADTISVWVQVPQGAGAPYLPDTTICSGDSVLLHAGSGYQAYIWSNGVRGQYQIVKQAGTYSVLAYTACDTFRGVAHIRTIESPSAFSLGADTALCPDAVLLLRAPKGSYNYYWQPGGYGNSYIQVRDTGQYSCVISNQCGSSSDSISVGRLYPPEGALGIYGDSTLCRNEVLVPAHVYNRAPYQRLWSTGDTGTELTIYKPQELVLSVYNSCGVHQERLFLHGCKGILAFPNAFSPNGDGRNDVFRPLVQDGSFLEYYVMKIFNRWGQQVFVSYHSDFGWSGAGQEPGTYYYYCRYHEWNKPEEFLTGEVILLK